MCVSQLDNDNLGFLVCVSKNYTVSLSLITFFFAVYMCCTLNVLLQGLCTTLVFRRGLMRIYITFLHAQLFWYLRGSSVWHCINIPYMFVCVRGVVVCVNILLYSDSFMIVVLGGPIDRLGRRGPLCIFLIPYDFCLFLFLGLNCLSCGFGVV